VSTLATILLVVLVMIEIKKAGGIAAVARQVISVVRS
jgi:hypothetical protein